MPAHRAAREGSRKRPTNLTIDADLLDAAKAAGINLSAELEQRLCEVLRERDRAAWRAENQEAVENYNARIERMGVFSTGLRRF
ncbi:MAG: type II toxin-antitoxin system CcdA family antitoxin [Alphaproteobacteria bacterium]|nr:type II toxin-antitoxin system CcdA family antitoxin [Alphaproteobacteria bacterium]